MDETAIDIVDTLGNLLIDNTFLETTTVDNVVLDIDYNIIEHFSKYLYSSPNKAVEELVTNGFDAGATWTKVFIPGEYCNDKIIVWDNGQSMDINGLKGLWSIADSPKKQENRDITFNNVSDRKVIGKFGIGKIASYTLGDAIVHICKTNGKYYFVNINYKEFVRIDAADGGLEVEKPRLKKPINEITEDKAFYIIKKLFDKEPEDLGICLQEPSFTIAVIYSLKTSKLTSGRLSWVLGNGMPLRPDFSIFLNEDKITPKLLRDNGEEVIKWEIGDPDFMNILNAKWSDAVGLDEVSGNLTFGKEVGLNPALPDKECKFVVFPNLGKVYGDIRLYKSTIKSAEKERRTHGFFFFVRHRLINPQDKDDRFFLHDPSFGTFYRSQFILYVDGIDSELLADRERISADSDKSKELKILELACYHLAYQKQQQLDKDSLNHDDNANTHLPVFSRELFIEPLSALWMQYPKNEGLAFDFRKPIIEKKPIGQNEPLSKLMEDGSCFAINTGHPYYKAIVGAYGHKKNLKPVLQDFDNIAITEELFHGFLFECGINQETINKILSWRDEMYRHLANNNRYSIEDAKKQLREASYLGDSVFEEAIVFVLELMGFKAERDGASGKKDVLMRALCGDNSYTLIFEAKGKITPGGLPNTAAAVGGASRHRIEAGAEHAVIVTRKFAGFDRGEGEAILGECRAQDNQAVSIMEVDALCKLLDIMTTHYYSLDVVKKIFTTIESPSEKLVHIQSLEQPLSDFDYFEFMNYVLSEQDELSDGKPVSVLSIYQKNYKKTLEYDDFLRKVQALNIIAFPLIKYDSYKEVIALSQSPELIAKLVQSKLEPEN